MAETKLKTYSQFLSITENKHFVEFLDNFISTIKKQEIALKNEKAFMIKLIYNTLFH